MLLSSLANDGRGDNDSGSERGSVITNRKISKVR